MKTPISPSVPRNRQPCLKRMLAAAAAASAEIMAIYADSERWQVAYKADDSPLTQADRCAQAVIMATLQDLGLAIVSEEMDVLPQRMDAAPYFLVDPLDGTREFLARNGEFTVNIALIEDHHPILAVVQVPADGRVYHAVHGHGAWLGERRLQSGAVTPLRVAVSRHHAQGERAGLQALAERCPFTLIERGSSLKIVEIAAGELDFYPRLGPTMAWDTAAAQLIVEEAGGCLCDGGGRRLSYGPPWRNPPFFASALSVAQSLSLLADGAFFQS